jgi:hypothetical protein
MLLGHEEHLIEHFLQIIFLHILQNKEQLIHMIFPHLIFSQLLEQLKQILILHKEQILLLKLFFEHIPHTFFSFVFIFLFFCKQSEHIINSLLSLFSCLLHKLQMFLKHKLHFIPQQFFISLILFLLSFPKNGL